MHLLQNVKTAQAAHLLKHIFTPRKGTTRRYSPNLDQLEVSNQLLQVKA